MLSDTHNRHTKLKIPKCDVLIHCGDYSSMGYEREVRSFYRWLDEQPAKYLISVQGNHELGWEKNPNLMTDIAKQECPNVILLNDSSTLIDGVKFYGTPVTPYFFNWAYNRGETPEDAFKYGVPYIKPHFDAIPNDINVLITHGPPFGVLDTVEGREGEPLGSKTLLEAVKRVKPDIHVFGHIHSSNGEAHINGTSFYNVSICDEKYLATRTPRIINL